MRTIILFVLLTLLFSPIGCKQTTEPTLSDMYVSYEIESAFQNDVVKVTLDDKILLDSKVTTNNAISLAWSSGLQKLSRTNHIINFAVVEYGVQKNFNIDTVNDTLTVSFRFNKSTKQISIRQIKGRVLRD